MAAPPRRTVDRTPSPSSFRDEPGRLLAVARDGRRWFGVPTAAPPGCSTGDWYTAAVAQGHDLHPLDGISPLSRFDLAPGGRAALVYTRCDRGLPGPPAVARLAADGTVEDVRDIAVPDLTRVYDIGWLPGGTVFVAGSPTRRAADAVVLELPERGGEPVPLGPLGRNGQVFPLADGRFAVATPGDWGVAVGRLGQAPDAELAVDIGTATLAPDEGTLAFPVMDLDNGEVVPHVLDLRTGTAAAVGDPIDDDELATVLAGPGGLTAWAPRLFSSELRVGGPGIHSVSITRPDGADGHIAVTPAGWEGRRLHVHEIDDRGARRGRGNGRPS